jgi:hypothetical protein
MNPSLDFLLVLRSSCWQSPESRPTLSGIRRAHLQLHVCSDLCGSQAGLVSGQTLCRVCQRSKRWIYHRRLVS